MYHFNMYFCILLVQWPFYLLGGEGGGGNVHEFHDANELLLYKLVSLQCTGLTCGGSIYPYIDAL